MGKMANKMESLMKDACEFQGMSLASRQKSSEEYRKKETDSESALRVMLDGLMARLACHMQNKIEVTNEKISYQISLSSSFVRTHFIINDLILMALKSHPTTSV
jgi:hypothetical protein